MKPTSIVKATWLLAAASSVPSTGSYALSAERWEPQTPVARSFGAPRFGSASVGSVSAFCR